MAKDFTVENVTEALHAAVARKGADYVYWRNANGACTYSVEDAGGVAQPSCIVGHVIHDLDPKMFQEFVEYENGHSTSLVINEIAHELNLTIDKRVLRILTVAQRNQDRGETWGTSVRVALEEGAGV